MHFKKAPHVLFNKESTLHRSKRRSSFASSPMKESRCACRRKFPGTNLRIEPVKMDFHYGTSFGKASPEAYERLLLDAMSGDATLFARRDEVEEAWSFIDPIEEAWHVEGPRRNLISIPPAHGVRKRPTNCSRVTAEYGAACRKCLPRQDRRRWNSR